MNDRVLWDSLQRADRDLTDELSRAAQYLEALPWEISAEIALPRKELVGKRGTDSDSVWASYWLAYGPFAGRVRLVILRKLDHQSRDESQVVENFSDVSAEVRLAAAELLPELVRLLKVGLTERLRAMQDARTGISKTLNRLEQADTLRRQSPERRWGGS